MAHNASYIIGSNTLRLFNVETIKPSSQWIENELNHSSWTCEKLQEQMDHVFGKIHKKLSCLILINSMQLSADLLQTAYIVATKFSNEIYMVSGTVARLQWAITETKLYYLDTADKAVIVYIFNNMCEINEIEAVSDSKYVFKSVEKCPKHDIHKSLRNFINSKKTKSLIFVSTIKEQKENEALRRMIERQYSYLSLHYIAEHISFMLLNGALAIASTIFCGKTSVPMFIQDFSMGFQIEYINDMGTFSESLIPFNKSIPITDTVTLSKIKSFCIRCNEELVVFPVIQIIFAKSQLAKAIIHESKEPGSVKITASINAHGVPSFSFKKIPDSSEFSNLKIDIGIIPMKFIIKLKDNAGSIWSKTDTEEYALLNVNQNEWTPFYVSFLRPKPAIGEKGYSHWKKSPKHVITDVHKVIGIPLKRIVSDVNWHFNIVPANDGTDYGKYNVEAHEGSQTISPEIIMSMFFAALKRLAQDHFKMDISQISIHVSSEDYKAEQIPFIKNAALAAGLSVENIEAMKF